MPTKTICNVTKFSYADYDVSANCCAEDVDLECNTGIQKFNQYRIRVYNTQAQKETSVMYYEPVTNKDSINLELSVYGIMVAVESLLIDAINGSKPFAEYAASMGFDAGDYERAKMSYKYCRSIYNHFDHIFSALDYELELVQGILSGLENIRVGDTVQVLDRRGITGVVASFNKDKAIIYTDDEKPITCEYTQLTKIQ